MNNLFRFLLLMILTSPALAMPVFVQCFDFGCKTTQEIHYSAEDWEAVRAEFDGVTDAASEKQAIRRAVARMEAISGRISGTHQDRGGNYPGSDIPQQMDCIDESTNTYQYLGALQELNLLRWHEPGIKHKRQSWIFEHWSATIRELDSGEVLVVDSWFLDNGELPYLQRLGDWHDRDDFPVDYNPELAANSP